MILITKSIQKKIKSVDELFLFKCECENIHMRHSGYVEMLMPYIQADKEKKVTKDSHQVMICTNCKKCYIWYSAQMYDITNFIDLEAWDKTEKDMYRATGPGGDC